MEGSTKACVRWGEAINLVWRQTVTPRPDGGHVSSQGHSSSRFRLSEASLREVTDRRASSGHGPVHQNATGLRSSLKRAARGRGLLVRPPASKTRLIIRPRALLPAEMWCGSLGGRNDETLSRGPRRSTAAQRSTLPAVRDPRHVGRRSADAGMGPHPPSARRDLGFKGTRMGLARCGPCRIGHDRLPKSGPGRERIGFRSSEPERSVECFSRISQQFEPGATPSPPASATAPELQSSRRIQRSIPSISRLRWSLPQRPPSGDRPGFRRARDGPGRHATRKTVLRSDSEPAIAAP
jgi:hypothetical protein